MIKFKNHIKFLIIFLFLSKTYAGNLIVIAVGDIMMGSDYPSHNLPPRHGSDLLKNLVDTLSLADLTLGNLEGVFLKGGTCTKTTEKGRSYAFRTPPSFAQNLLDAGFDFMNLANNHMNDFGPEGIVSTTKTLSDLGIAYGGPDEEPPSHFCLKEKNIAVVCFSTSPRTRQIFDITEAQRIVAAQSRENDIVIVSFHGGGEGVKYLHARDTFEYFLDQPRGNVVKFARAVVDSGADFVWGHGPHVPRAMEIYRDRLIAYSLGNFCTWGFNIADQRGYAPILRIALDSTGVFKEGRIISARQGVSQPLELDTLHNAAKLIKQLSLIDFPNSAPVITDDGFILPLNVSN